MSTLIRYSGLSCRGFETQCLLCKAEGCDRTTGEIDVPLETHAWAAHQKKLVAPRHTLSWAWGAEETKPKKKFFRAVTDEKHPTLYLGGLVGGFSQRTTLVGDGPDRGRVMLALELSVRWVPVNRACQQYVPAIVSYKIDREESPMIRLRAIVRASVASVFPVAQKPLTERGRFCCFFKYDASRELEPFFPNVLIPSLPPLILPPGRRAASFTPGELAAAEIAIPPYSLDAPPDPPPEYAP